MTLPREDLFIKEKWHQQRKEESMIEKEDASVEIYAHDLVCFTTKKIEISDGILPTDILLSVNLNYRRILPTDSQI